MGNHSRPDTTHYKFLFVVVVVVFFTPRRMGRRAWACFLPRIPVIFFPTGFFSAGFFLVPV